MAETLDTTTEGELDIIVNAGHSFNVVFTRFEDDETTPENWPADIKIALSTDSSGTQVKKTYTVGDGLTIAGNTLTLSQTAAQNTLNTYVYSWDMRTDSGGFSSKELKGKFIVQNTIAR